MTKYLRTSGLLLTMSLLATMAAGDQRQEYEAEVPKTILELQQFRTASSIPIKSGFGREGTATLVNLNPGVNVWHLLKIVWKGSDAEAAFHLENPQARTRTLLLDERHPSGLVIVEGNARSYCDLFRSNALDQARASAHIFHPLCDGRIFLRNPAIGNRTTLEAATEFLREHVWGGEKIVALGHILLGEAERETGKMQPEVPSTFNTAGSAADLPLPALIASQYADRPLVSNNLGIDVGGVQRTGMIPGAWYAARWNPGIYVSILQPNLIDPAILQTYKTAVNALDNVEASSLSYLMAFDLDQFELGYALGTEHPKVGWSNRILDQMKNRALPGPDGIAKIIPLVATGLVGPDKNSKTVATFTAGFKRTHGAFKSGDLALRNHGNHYGFMENGVVFSKLQPGLATIFVLQDGSIEMKTWTAADNNLLARMKHARQNGVPLIEFDSASRSSFPGPLVARWGPGNWSGSEGGKLRTMRSGAGLQTKHGKRYLIYAVFSDATPSAMSRVFQAYQCDYAMLLDMNALEHTYAVLYRRSGSQMFVDHLLKGMGVLEKSGGGEIIPRFLGYADNRDFFYVMRRNGVAVKP